MFLQRGTGEKTTLFDVEKETISPKVVAPEAEQEEFESRRFVEHRSCTCRKEPNIDHMLVDFFFRLWSKVTKGLTTRNLDFATMEKTVIEDNQRTIVKDRAAKGTQWELRFFTQYGDGWRVALDL